MLDPLTESLWFYTAAEYLIVNAFLWRNKAALERCIDIVFQNDRAVIAEAQKETPEKRFAFSRLDCEALYQCYLRRTPEELTSAAKRRMLETAISDIRLICHSMYPAGEAVRLIRNMEKAYSLKSVRKGERIDLLGVTSTSTTGQLIDYGVDDFRKPDQILLLDIPEGTPLLFLKNEENEVLLPPMRYVVTAEAVNDGIHTVTLNAEHPLNIEELIRASEEAFPEYFK